MMKCISREKAANGNVTSYIFMSDTNGQRISMSAEQVKTAMQAKKFFCENLTLSSDGRLILHGENAEDTSSQIVEDIKHALFADANVSLTNAVSFNPSLKFLTWCGDQHSFIITDAMGTEYRVSVQKEL